MLLALLTFKRVVHFVLKLSTTDLFDFLLKTEQAFRWQTSRDLRQTQSVALQQGW